VSRVRHLSDTDVYDTRTTHIGEVSNSKDNFLSI